MSANPLTGGAHGCSIAILTRDGERAANEGFPRHDDAQKSRSDSGKQAISSAKNRHYPEFADLPIPSVELLASGIPSGLHPLLGYRRVTADQAHHFTGYRLSGWIVPMTDPDGLPYEHDGRPFYRLKPDPGQLSGNDAPRYLSPKGGGCRPYFSPLLDHLALSSSRPLFITEGEKKADAMAAHGYTSIGLAGVDAWRDHRSGQSAPLPELEQVNWRGREVFVTFDSDVTAKASVRGALEGLCLWLIKQGATPRIVLIPSEVNGDKNGVDDFLARHGREAFDTLVRIARPCGIANPNAPAQKQFSWIAEPKHTHHKALMGWCVFKESHAYRPGFGFFRWMVDHWAPIPGKELDALNPALHRWMDGMGFESRSSSVMGSVRSELAARLHADDWDPPHLMAFSNGTLNTVTNEFILGHRREHRLTFCFPFPMDRGAVCPTWEAFLSSTLNDPGLIRLMRAAIRWSVMPKDRHQPFKHELAFDVHGPRRAGKGTLAEVLQTVCGGLDGGVGLIKSASFSNANALHGLIGKRVAIDPDASGRVSDPGVFNAIASNEPVEVKRLYADVGAERLGVVVWRFFNDQPGASGGGLEGMGRRIVPFRFERPVDRPDRDLKAKLAAEAAGIFWWAWSMAEEEMHDTLANVGQVRAIREAAVEAGLERDPILRFLVETYPEGHEAIPARDLFQQWRRWTQQEGHEPGSSTWFGKGIKKIPAVTAWRSNQLRGYRIAPMKDINLSLHLGIALPADLAAPASDGLNLSPDPTCHPHLSPPKPLSGLASLSLVTGLTGSEENNGLDKKEGGAGVEEPENARGEEFEPKLVKPVIRVSEAAAAEPTALQQQARQSSSTPFAVENQKTGWHQIGVGSSYDVTDDDDFGDDPAWGPRPK